jgi:hypothetical protein
MESNSSNVVEKLKKLREPFPKEEISKLPKPTKRQTEELKADIRKGIRCKECGGWHHKDVIHLDYVGHAAVTNRLLSVDPTWSYDFMCKDAAGMPVFDKLGGLWIELTVCGVTRKGYGCAEGKNGPDAIKEIIGDALRNASMRFGVALELWAKDGLIVDDAETKPADKETVAVKNEQYSDIERQKDKELYEYIAKSIYKIKELIRETGSSMPEFIKFIGAKSLENATKEQLDYGLSALMKKKEQLINAINGGAHD